MLQAVYRYIVNFKYCNSGWDSLDRAIGLSKNSYIKTSFNKLVKDSKCKEPFLSSY